MRIAIPGIRSIGLSSAERWLGKMTGTGCNNLTFYGVTDKCKVAHHIEKFMPGGLIRIA